MTENSLNDKDWQKLIRKIESGHCVLMLGSDIPLDEHDAAMPSLTALLARHLASQIADRIKICDADDLPHVAQNYLANKTGGDRDDLEMEVESFYHSFQEQTTQLYKSLAGLPFSHCINMTPDDFMLNAFKEVGKAPLTDFYHFRSGNKVLSVNPSVQTPLVYKLCGDISEGRSLVLTETDLLDFLANIIASRPELPPALSKLFGDKETSFLFVGFGFHRWHLRILLHLFRNRLTQPSWSLALEDTRFFSGPGHQQTSFFYDHIHSIHIKSGSWHTFADDLSNRYRQIPAEDKKESKTMPPKDAPTVFLCHSSEDSEAVDLLREKLNDLGLNTWRDRDNLRGGELWDRRIKHLIENNGIDYFLVLQTPHMLGKAQSYFVQEINLALNRQAQNWPGFLFIIPAFFLGKANQKLEELSAFNYIDLRHDKELQGLVEDIQDDRLKRLARKALAHAN